MTAAAFATFLRSNLLLFRFSDKLGFLCVVSQRFKVLNPLLDVLFNLVSHSFGSVQLERLEHRRSGTGFLVFFHPWSAYKLLLGRLPFDFATGGTERLTVRKALV